MQSKLFCPLFLSMRPQEDRLTEKCCKTFFFAGGGGGGMFQFSQVLRARIFLKLNNSLDMGNIISACVLMTHIAIDSVR